MGVLKRLFGRKAREHGDDPRPLLDWLGNDDDAVELGRVEHFDVFLEDVREVAAEGSILVLEGKPAADVREFLKGVQVQPDVRIARGTTWPKQEFLHVAATRENFDQLLELSLNHAEPEIGDHLVLYRNRQVLLWLHDIADGYVYGHPLLGDSNLDRIRRRLKQKRR